MQMLCIMCFSDFALPHAKDDTDLLWFEREDFDIERSDDDDPAINVVSVGTPFLVVGVSNKHLKQDQTSQDLVHLTESSDMGCSF